MNKRTMPGFALILLLMLSGAASAQQDTAPSVVRLEGMSAIMDSLARLENKLDRLLNSRWEYRIVRRNRLNRPVESDAQLIEALGLDGWELVTVTVEEGFILKRRIRSR